MNISPYYYPGLRKEIKAININGISFIEKPTLLELNNSSRLGLLLHAIFKVSDISVDKLMSSDRSWEFMYWRHLYYYISDIYLDIQSTMIAKKINRKDHSVVCNGKKRINNLIDIDDLKVKEHMGKILMEYNNGI